MLPTEPASTPVPVPEDERLLDALAAADEALDKFLPAAVDGGWNALAARLEMVGHIMTPDSGSAPRPNGIRAEPSRPMQIGRYEVLEELGSGGFGIVFRAYDPRLRRVVALKVPRPELLLTAEFRRRFLREAQAAGSLDHPGIVPVYDAAEIGPVCYIASACCDGPNLAVWLKERNKPVPANLAAQILVRLADAVRYTHEHGIVHRDIKPSNVLLYAESDEKLPDDRPSLGFTPRLGDFGLARLAEEQPAELTVSGLALGSPPYMSPEQAVGKRREIGPAADIYSLGAVLYELLTGRPPFRGETSTETLRLVIEADPVAPRMLRSGVPRDLETIVLKCLQKDPMRRYGTAAALRDDLKRHLAGRPILSRPPPPWHHAFKAARRHPAVAVLLTLVALLALGAGGAVAWSNAQLRRHTVELELERDLSDRLHYASQLQLARSARDEGHLGAAQQLLGEFRLYPTAPDRREFAWRYLSASASRELVLLAEVDSSVGTAAVSRDGRLLLVSDKAGGLGGFDLRAPAKIWSQPRKDATHIDAMTFDARGRVFVVAYRESNADGSDTFAQVELRESATGRRLAALPSMRGRAVFDVKLLGDGSVLAVHHGLPGTGAGARIDVWDVGDDSFRSNARLLGQREGLERISFSPDGLSFAARDSAGRIGLFETVTLESRGVLADAPFDLDLPVQFAPDGLRVAAGHRPNRSLTVWDAATGRRLRVLDGFASPVLLTAIQPGGEALVAVENSQAVHRINLNTGGKTPVFAASPNPASVNTSLVSFTTDGAAFLVQRASYLKPDVIELRDSSDGHVMATCPTLPAGYCWFWELLGVDSGGPALVFSIGRSVWLWRYEASLASRAQPKLSHADEAWALAFSPSGSTVATGSDDSTDAKNIRLWNLQTGRLIQGWKGHDATVTGLAFSPDGLTLASSSLGDTNNVKLWDAMTGALVDTLDWPKCGARAVAFSPDGRLLAAAGNEGGVRVWEMPARHSILQIPAHQNRVHRLAFAPDGRTLATVGDDQFVRLWSLPSGELLRGHREPGELFALAYSPDGKTLAVAGRSRLITLLDPATLSPRRRIRSDDSELRTLAFSPDGLTLASAGKGQTVRLWDPVTGQQLLPLGGPSAQVNALAFSPDGKTIGACDHSGRIWLYRDESP